MPRPSLNDACTKIVATVGPACSTPEKLAELIEAGADVFRINSAHGTREQHAEALANIRKASDACGNAVGVLLDLSGPKLRLGQLTVDPLVCEVGMRVTFVRGEVASAPNELTSSYKRLIDELAVEILRP